VKRSWSAPTSWEEVKKRAAGRAKYNALRRLNAQLRRRQVLQLLGEIGWTYGSQATVARQLGVSEATISRDMATILPLYRECAHCGSLVPRVWFAEE